MTIRVLFFGVLAEVTGTGLKVYEDVKTVDHLKIRVADDHPEIIHYSFGVSLNNELIDGDAQLKDGDEIAFLPPLPEDDNRCLNSRETMNVLIKGPITPNHIAEELAGLSANKETGGHSIFLGQVREDVFEGKRVKAIEYTAYDEMVKTEAGRIRDTIFKEYPDVLSVVILHSVGLVLSGELSLFILVSARHRDQATKACRQTLELIKEKFPVWKKELFEDDSRRWQHNI